MFRSTRTKIRRLREREADPREPVGRVDDLEPLGGEELPHQQAVARVVFDVEDA